MLQRIDEHQRNAVEEVTLDLSESMRKIVRIAFPKASRVIDRFHIQKYWCPLKIFGDFRDFYFLGQPIYWTHK